MNGGSSSGIPSNLGILDQIAALHWIQENIQDFGGKDKTQHGFFIVSQTKCVGWEISAYLRPDFVRLTTMPRRASHCV